MFRRHREERDRGRRIGGAVAEYMDGLERNDWAQLNAGTPGREPKEAAEFVANVVADLLDLADNDINAVMQALEVWHDSRSARFEEAGDESRAGHVSGVYLSISLNGIGNLYGLIPEHAPSYRPEHAAECRRRVWRQ